MNKLIICLAIVASCAQPDFVTSQGIDVYCNSADHCFEKEDVDETIDIFLSISGKGSALRDVFDSWPTTTLEITTDFINCESHKEGCGGTYVDREITVMFTECISYSSLSHELAHMMQSEIYDMIDADHEDRRFFHNSCPKFDDDPIAHMDCEGNTIVYKSFVAGREDICF